MLNAAGQVAFQATLTGDSSTSGVFAHTPAAGTAPASTAAVALQGQAAPAGGNYSSFATAPVLNPAGRVVFQASLAGGTSTSGLFAHTPAAGGEAAGTAAVAVTGQAAPAGGTYSSFSAPVLNAAGQVAFQASLAGGTSTQGLFAHTPAAGTAPASTAAVALQGQAAPAGGSYVSFSAPVLNAAGQVAFAAGLTGGVNNQGLFAWTPAAGTAAVAVTGQAAPAGGNYSIFSAPAVNAAGQVAFGAVLTGTGVTAANDRGLFVWDPAGRLTEVVREGQQVDVDPTAGVLFKTVADNGINFAAGFGGEDGRGTGLSDIGRLAYTLTFTDGTRGVFTVLVVPVPEPATVGLVAAAGLLVGRRVRRRYTAQA